MRRIALFGGIYSNYLALAAAIAHARGRGVDAIYCLGDLGAFGPHPDRTIDLICEHQIACVRGNYDDSVGRALADCQCGYTDERDNYFARLSYDYTLAHTSPENRAWLRTLPAEIRLEINGCRILLCHGSPRRMNEFLWESTSSTHFLADLTENQFINVGVLGRPENDGRTNAWYTIIEFPRETNGTRSVPATDFIPVEYDHHRLAAEMRAERLPDEFIATILTGWWTTCLEILPSKERRRGQY
jgi:predicted phosphodiesterase